LNEVLLHRQTCFKSHLPPLPPFQSRYQHPIEYRISCLNPEDYDRCVNKDTLLATYLFPSPGLPLLEFSRLVKIVSEHSENYQINSTMCYWFSAMIMEVSRRQLFPRDPNNRPVPAGLPKGAGYYMTVLRTTSKQWTKDSGIIEQRKIQRR
jgi:hypothetical protein